MSTNTASTTIVWEIKGGAWRLLANKNADVELRSDPFDQDRWQLCLKASGFEEHFRICRIGVSCVPGAFTSTRHPSANQSDAFLIRCTLSRAPYLPVAPPLAHEPPPTSAALVTAFGETFFDARQFGDVVFSVGIVNGSGPRRRIFASKDFLAKRSSYFRDKLAVLPPPSIVSFPPPASASSSTDDAPSPAKRPKHILPPQVALVLPSAVSRWIDDDDSLEWLPQEWLKKYGPAAAQGADDSDGPVYGKHRLPVIEVTDTGYITYRAVLFYLHTERITFTPPASSFTVALVAGDETAAKQSRRAFLLKGVKKAVKGKSGVEPASAHAVYRLSDRMGVTELKKLAKEAIVGSFTAENVLYELVSSFSHHHLEIGRAALEFAWANWDAVKATPSFPRVVAGASSIEGGARILTRLLTGLAAPVKEDGAGGEGERVA
ncbi:hypothetical protein JCM6882_001257 [Rhodosporidiobolus microsporus]